MLEIGSLVDGKYKILNKVGQGGMSVVYLAMNEKANKQWAVKEVRKDGTMNFEAVKQGLVAETDILKRLNHPNLPSIIDVIDNNESFIIIMDYIQGNSLSKALEEYGAQPQENVIEWAKQLCDVLGYLHTRTPPIIYRDLKPANVMLKPDGNIALIDFGTAREYKEKNLADTTCLGTIGYAAPEQYGGMGQTDGRTDIFNLGATLYHLVTGKNPCEPPYEIRPIREINPNLSSGLEQIILKCTKPDPNDRYQSAAELMYALEHYDELDVVYRKKQKKKLAAFLTPVFLAAVFTAVSVWGYVSAEKQQTANYDYIIAEAAEAAATMQKEPVIQKYYEAILTDPSRTEAYVGSGELLDENSGLVGFLIKNHDPQSAEETPYILTSDESAALSKLDAGLDKTGSGGFQSTVKVLEELKRANPEGYNEVCTLIGEAHLFFFDSSKIKGEQYTKAATWYKRVQDSNPMAKTYCDIAKCIQNIEKYTIYEPDSVSSACEGLWKQITDLKDAVRTANYSDYTKLRIWIMLTDLIQDFTANLTDAANDSEKLTIDGYCDTLREIGEEVAKLPQKTQTENDIRKLQKKIEEQITVFQSSKGAQ